MKIEIIDSYIDELLKIEKNYAPFFEKVKALTLEDDYADFLNIALDKIQDTFVAKIIIVEINKLNNKKNFQTLLDFILVKKPKDFMRGQELCDLTQLKILCVKTISNYKDRTSVTPLLYCLNSKEENYKFRLAVAEALGKIGDNSAVDSLINVVKDEDEKSVYVRESAAKALGMLGDKRAVEPFLGILEGKKGFLSKFTFLKERVLEALGKLNIEEDKRINAVLSDALQDSCAQVRLNALESISNSNSYQMFAEVQELLKDEDEDVASAAVITLYNLSDRKILDKIIEDKNAKECCKKQAQEIINEYEREENDG